jgi:hypothetical protein
MNVEWRKIWKEPIVDNIKVLHAIRSEALRFINIYEGVVFISVTFKGQRKKEFYICPLGTYTHEIITRLKHRGMTDSYNG